jgi:hypothetical protein
MQQTQAFTGAQVGALTGANMDAFLTAYASPIILDLDGNGVSTTSVSDGVSFDIRGDGTSVRTGWVGAGDGLLVLDRNHDGIVNSGTELFGGATSLADGSLARDGFQALGEFDSSADGTITNTDSVWQDLRVWVDKNQDGVSDSNELHRLDDLGITSLNLASAEAPTWNSGNIVGLVSDYQTADGATHDMADVWFATDPVVEELVSTKDQGGMSQIAQVDMSVRVTELAQAIGLFDAIAPVNEGVVEVPQLPTDNTLASTSDLSVAISDMVQVMSQFDSQSGAPLSVPSTTSLDSMIKKPDQTGMLTSGK